MPNKDSNKHKISPKDINFSKSPVTVTVVTPKFSFKDICYRINSVIDEGTFGVVFKVKIGDQVLAMKKVMQDPDYRNREVDILRVLSHPNIVTLHLFYYDVTRHSRYLHIFMDFMPTNIARVICKNTETSPKLSAMVIKIYMYQMFCALHYMHSLDILHRDIKPSNLLVDPSSNLLKLCDFGNAKKVMPNEPSVDYICSRYYRAPELILGAVFYSTPVDVWSAGCVLAECFLPRPLFEGFDSDDQLVKIVRVLGTPSTEELVAMRRRNETRVLGDFQRVDLRSVLLVLLSRLGHL